jgi:hypothetical protein
MKHVELAVDAPVMVGQPAPIRSSDPRQVEDIE